MLGLTVCLGTWAIDWDFILAEIGEDEGILGNDFAVAHWLTIRPHEGAVYLPGRTSEGTENLGKRLEGFSAHRGSNHYGGSIHCKGYRGTDFGTHGHEPGKRECPSHGWVWEGDAGSRASPIRRPKYGQFRIVTHESVGGPSHCAGGTGV